MLVFFTDHRDIILVPRWSILTGTTAKNVLLSRKRSFSSGREVRSHPHIIAIMMIEYCVVVVAESVRAGSSPPTNGRGSRRWRLRKVTLELPIIRDRH